MALVVQKYGGSSLADINRIQAVAERIVRQKRKGDRVVVVVSAMGETTDRLLALARQVSRQPDPRELDMLLSAGERQTMALLALAIMGRGEKAQSFTGSQVGIITDQFHSDARIQEIRLFRITEALRRGRIPIVAGFQGVSEAREITTLGRGGSDVTAVALAAVLKADRCELYKDVAGVGTENPGEFPGAKVLKTITFTELAELAQAGAEIIHPRACALAEKYRVPLFIRSSFTNQMGTVVTDEKEVTMTAKRRSLTKDRGLEKAFVRAITHQHHLARIALLDVAKKQRCLHQVVTALSEARVPVLLFNHGVVHGERFDLIFYIPAADLATAQRVITGRAIKIKAQQIDIARNFCSVSLVGPGVGTDATIIADTFATLHQAHVHLDAFSLTATRLTCFIRQEDLRLATTALLTRFRLTKK